MEKLSLSQAGQFVKLPEELFDLEPTHASRYWILANILRSLGASKKTKILDVGGKKGLLRSFAGFAPTIIDIEESDEPNFVQGDALHMPFKDNEYSYSVSCDVLEHIPAPDRKRFLLEMLRVSREGVILCAPFDHDRNAELEQKMNDYYAHLSGEQHRWLREHIDNGLPQESEVEQVLKSAGYGYVKFRHFSPQTWESIVSQHLLHAAFGDSERLGEMVRTMYRDYYAQLCNLDFTEDGYRTFFWISKKGTPVVELPAPDLQEQARDAFNAKNQELFLQLAEDTLLDQRKRIMKGNDQEARLKELKRAHKQVSTELATAQAELDRIKSSPAWKALRGVKRVVDKARSVR
jgi:hypothetical protein